MASKRPNPASHADPRPIPIDARVSRHGAITKTDKPGTLRVTVVKDGKESELVGKEALERLPTLVRQTDAPIWVDLIAPTASQAKHVGKALSLHPLIVEDVLEGNQRAKIESTDGVVHIVLFHLSYGDRVIASEVDIVLGTGSC
jgi:magnesium transporter